MTADVPAGPKFAAAADPLLKRLSKPDLPDFMVGKIARGKYRGVRVAMGEYFCRSHPHQLLSYKPHIFHGSPRLAKAASWCPQCRREARVAAEAEAARRRAETVGRFAELARAIEGMRLAGERMRRRAGTPISNHGGKHVARLLRARRISGEKRTRRD